MKLKNIVNTIFFDVDHTLWDFEKNSALTFNKILDQYDFPFSNKEFLDIYIPINKKYWDDYSKSKISKENLKIGRLKKTFTELRFKYSEKLIIEISDLYIKNLPKQTFLFNGVLDILKYLKPKYKLHIITNGFEYVQQKKLEFSGIRHFFDKIINSENAGAKKPSNKIFNYALKLTNQKSGNCLMIGDNFEADIMGAINIGMNAIHFNSTGEPYHNKCQIIYCINDLKQIL
ncbi:MAG: noncanonical pyrimidine nucleotidase, YjjG family [Flavobacteriaceae bacterium]|nr:noncanonical pyrimidine nucleotidase, YjjG family [Flavobacteriaceae bacterium]|tara:strand:+ start:2610 stop:3302 length:693 start_codon:yes stop_codon:yes gene_type:complete